MPHAYLSHVRACFVPTYPPRQCGIATFTADLCQALCQGQDNTPPGVMALTNTANEYQYPPEVVFEIRQNQLRDYRLATEYINLSSMDVICLQHEFGIFGGEEGRYVLELLRGLRKPVVTTLHTVLREPTPAYREALLSVAMLSDHLVVMNSKAIQLLQDVYHITPEKVSCLHHGVSQAPFVDPNYYKDKFGVEGRLVLLTFGLLSRNKGIELMLNALPTVVRAHPEVVYLILGATHPEVRRSEGKAYRLMLQRQVRALHLEDHVLFYTRYVELPELLEYLGACDTYVTPCQAREQIVSGTLAYAVGIGKAVVSTPYLYAEEILADGRGQLVPFGDAPALARTLMALIESEVERHRMRKLAYAYGQQMIWSEVAKGYRTLFERVVTTHRQQFLARSVHRLTQVRYALPEIKLDHLRRLTDDTGIIQHATYDVPDRCFGYTTDDAARALVVTLMHYRQCGDEVALDLAMRYLSFLAYAQLPDGHFHNMMSYTRQFCDERGSEDPLGRALWGLGTTVALAPGEGMRALARERFERALDALALRHPRALAYAVCGLYNFLQRYDGAALARRKLVECAERLVVWYERSCVEDHEASAGAWPWFGDALTFSSERIVPVYAHYNDRAYYVAISNADRHPHLTYVATVYHGIALAEFTLRQEHGTYLLFFGRIHPDKGVAEAIAVAQRAHMPLYIAGIVQDRAYYAREVAPHLDGERVRYLGTVGPDQRDALLGSAYALLHLVNFAEPFGLSMVEAMACGTPVIACGRGSVPEIIRHGETGFLVQSSDEAVAALSQVKGLHRARIRQHVADNFSQERMIDHYIKVYEEILRMEATGAASTSPTFEQRPWGSYTVLDEGHHYKVKRLEILPGKRLSYQKHTQRTEHWMVVQGSASVTLEGQEMTVETGGTMDVPRGAAHRIANPGSEILILIEIQRGSYLGEDDIIRLEDDYGRAPASVQT